MFHVSEHILHLIESNCRSSGSFPRSHSVFVSKALNEYSIPEGNQAISLFLHMRNVAKDKYIPSFQPGASPVFIAGHHRSRGILLNYKLLR